MARTVLDLNSDQAELVAYSVIELLRETEYTLKTEELSEEDRQSILLNRQNLLEVLQQFGTINSEYFTLNLKKGDSNQYVCETPDMEQ